MPRAAISTFDDLLGRLARAHGSGRDQVTGRPGRRRPHAASIRAIVARLKAIADKLEIPMCEANIQSFVGTYIDALRPQLAQLGQPDHVLLLLFEMERERRGKFERDLTAMTGPREPSRSAGFI
jgi:hypothetical protein